MLRFQYVFYTKYVNSQIRQILAYILDKLFNKVPAFYGKRDRIIFLSGNYSILTANENLIEHIKTPYALIYNENLNDSYNPQFHANFHAYGFRKKIFYAPKIDTIENSPLKTSINNFYIILHHNRVSYTITMSLVASSYDELIDITTSFSSLIVPNRYYLHHIPVDIYIPNEIKLRNSNTSLIIDLAKQSNILKTETFKLINKESLVYRDTIPVYVKLDSINNMPLPLFETTEPIYRTEVNITLDLPVIKTIELIGLLPILGVNLQVNVDSNIVIPISDNIESYKTHIFEQKIEQNNQTEVEFNITINNDEELNLNSIIVLLNRNIEPQNENVYNIIALHLPYNIEQINDFNYKIKTNYNFNIGDIIKLRYETKNKT